MGKPGLKSGNPRYKNKGLYEIKNVHKYVGNPTECIYRSTWEFKFMIYCDFNENIRKWGSELDDCVITYYIKNEKGDLHPHRYFPDFFIERYNSKDPNDYRTFMIELKPYKEYKPDCVVFDETGNIEILKPSSNKNLKAFENWEYQVKTFQKNFSKWQAADKWCRNRNMEFKVVHEHILKEWGVL